MDYFTEMVQSIRKDHSRNNLIKKIINPVSSYFMADHYYGDVLKFPDSEGQYPKPQGTNLMDEQDAGLSKIKDFDIIHVHSGYSSNYGGHRKQEVLLHKFLHEILPKINKKIVLITTTDSECYHDVLDEHTNKILINDNVVLWFATNNRIKHKKCRMFPLGVNWCGHFIKGYAKNLMNGDPIKTQTVVNLNLGMNWVGRKLFPVIPRMEATEFFSIMKTGKYIPSPRGDRPDCYRYWEAIGLGTIPISDIPSEFYYGMFGDSMYFVDKQNIMTEKDFLPLTEEQTKDMNLIVPEHYFRLRMIVKLLENPSLLPEYVMPDRNLVTFDYWKKYVLDNINDYKMSNIYRVKEPTPVPIAHEHEHEPKLQTYSPIKIINLGCDSSSRATLAHYGINTYPSPFDPVITPMSALLKCLKEDFADYYNPKFFTLYFDSQTPINKYGIILSHTFPHIEIPYTETSVEIAKLTGLNYADVEHSIEYSTCQRKAGKNTVIIIDPNWKPYLQSHEMDKFYETITKFRTMCKFDCKNKEKLKFFRYNDISKENAETFVTIIETQYPLLDFELICVNTRDNAEHTDWNCRKIKNYTVNVNNPMDDEWKKILINFN